MSAVDLDYDQAALLDRLIAEREMRSQWWRHPYRAEPIKERKPRPLPDLSDIPGYGMHLELAARIDLLVAHGRLD